MSARKARSIGLMVVFVCSVSLIELPRGKQGTSKGAVQGLGMGNSELKYAAQRAEICSASNVAGVGLRGEYFTKAQWRGEPSLVRTDSSIDFGPSIDWPSENRHGVPLSVRWTGWIKSPMTGSYRFHIEPARARVVVSKQVVAGEGSTSDATFHLAAGRFYPILVEIDQLNDASRVRLEWTAPHGAKYVVPRALLSLPTETVTQVLRQ
jgi:PA14 domain